MRLYSIILFFFTIACQDPDGDIKVNTSPTVVISSPETMSVFYQNEEITFTAVVADDQQSAETISLIWNSDSDGILLEGNPDENGKSELIIDTLSEGIHVISLTAIDERNASGRNWIQIEIDEPPDVEEEQEEEEQEEEEQEEEEQEEEEQE